jgi:hypothetical protein
MKMVRDREKGGMGVRRVRGEEVVRLKWFTLFA